jgi:hypothetical protein
MIVSMPAPSDRKMLTLPSVSMILRSRSTSASKFDAISGMYTPWTSQPDLLSPSSGAQTCWSSHAR